MGHGLVLGRSFAVLVGSILLSVLAHNFLKSKKKSVRPNADGTDASSSSGASAGSDSFHVFLSFYGEDTRKKFADHLYNGLIDAGVRVFRDDNELQEGEKISTNLFQAIKNSKISIPILSRNYASSEWCLQELVEMMECMKCVGHVVLPIFYEVEPTHVRHQTGSFGKSFSRLSWKYLKEDVEIWKNALEEVTSLKGLESEKIADGHEGELVNKVVRKVRRKLYESFQVFVTNQLVGINNAVDDILRLLNDNATATQFVGIHGMGGIGKTTLAKVVYNKLLYKFEHHSIVENIQEFSQGQGISHLHKKTVPDQGSEDRFKGKKALILLDNVDGVDQLKALVGKPDWFGMGSKIIITTRLKSVLNAAGVECQYEHMVLAEDKSLKLFSRHAFSSDSPPPEFESLSRDVVSTTGGLPLALEVIGLFLRGKNRALWQKSLKELKRVPLDEVRKNLKISYDALNEAEKQIFLDIACFFIGYDVRIVSYMWDACGYHPILGIDKLTSMSLIKITNDGELTMHDQLRDLGMEIVRGECYELPRNRSRLWVYEEALEVLQGTKGLQKDRVQGIWLTNFWEVEFTTEQFEMLPNLRLLRLCDLKRIGDSKSLLPELRWLSWTRRHTFVPASFDLKKLVILDLSLSDISELWDGWSYLKKIHPSIGQARDLVVLNLNDCERLQELPKEIGELKELNELSIEWTEIKELPPWMGSLKKLEVFNANSCKSLIQLPDLIGKLEWLTELQLSCSRIRELPESIGDLKYLKILNISESEELSNLPMAINKLGKLEELNAEECRLLEGEVPLDGLSSLRTLRLRETRVSGFLGELKNPSRLEKLDLWFCKMLRSLPHNISEMTSLQYLDFTYCEKIPLLPEIHAYLTILGVTCQHQTLPQLSHLTRLSELTLAHCRLLESIPELPPELSVLRVYDCDELKELPSLSSLESLSELDLELCGELTEIKGLEALKSLAKLTVSRCGKLSNLDGIEHLESLRYLCVSEFSESDAPLLNYDGFQVRSLDKLKNLEELQIGNFQLDKWYVLQRPLSFNKALNLVKIEGLQSLKKLRKLRFEWGKDVRSCWNWERRDVEGQAEVDL